MSANTGGTSTWGQAAPWFRGAHGGQAGWAGCGWPCHNSLLPPRHQTVTMLWKLFHEVLGSPVTWELMSVPPGGLKQVINSTHEPADASLPLPTRRGRRASEQPPGSPFLAVHGAPSLRGG